MSCIFYLDAAAGVNPLLLTQAAAHPVPAKYKMPAKAFIFIHFVFLFMLLHIFTNIFLA